MGLEGVSDVPQGIKELKVSKVRRFFVKKFYFSGSASSVSAGFSGSIPSRSPG